MSRHKHALFLALLLAFGAAGRCRRYFACLSHWYDEAYLLLNVFDKSFLELFGPLQEEQAAPPLFLCLLRGLYLLAGRGEWIMRLPSFVASLAALFLMVPLARRIAGPRGAWWAVGWCALSHHAVYHACEVKPYAGDLLLAEVVLLAAANLLLLRSSRFRRRPPSPPRAMPWALPWRPVGAQDRIARISPNGALGESPGHRPGRSATNPGRSLLDGAGGRWKSAGVLLLLAAFGPWFSFPSTFLLGGAAMALLLEGWRRPNRALVGIGSGLCLILALSCVLLWILAARHHDSPALQRHWAPHFPDLSSPCAALTWTVRCGVRMGHYASTGLGAPLLVLASVGLVVLGRRSGSLVVLLLAPLGLAFTASVLHYYPLGNRLLLFAAPCLWLPAAAAVEAVIDVRPAHRAVVVAVALAGLLLPEGVSMGKSLVAPPTGIDFREAFAHVHEHWAEGDAVWVSHPQVYEVYFGRPPWLLGFGASQQRVEQAARNGRLWMIYNPPGPRRACFPEVFALLRSLSYTPVRKHHVQGLEIELYAPPGR